MSYRLSPSDADVEEFLRRVAGEQLGRAISALEGGGPQAVHEARRRVKKTRALIRLLRDSFPDYRDANRALRDAARLTSGQRDRTALIQSYDRLLAHPLAHEIDGRTTQPLRRALVSRQHALEGRAEEMRAALGPIRQAAEGWTLDRRGWRGLAPGLARTYGRGQEGFTAASTGARDASTLHDWRKRAKYHRYHTRLLGPIWPGPLGARQKALHALTATLGHRHDLDVLRAELERGDLAEAPARALTRALDAVAAAETRAAIRIGAPLFAPKPKALLREWRAAWKVRFER